MQTVNITLPNRESITINSVIGYAIDEQSIANEDNPEDVYSTLCWVDASISYLHSDEICVVIKGINAFTQKMFELRVSNSELIADFRSTIIKRMASLGCKINYGKQKDVMKYLARQVPNRHIVSVDQIGWHKGMDDRWVYARPQQVIGETVPPVTFLQSDESVVHKAIHSKGTLDDEKKYISDYFSGNPFLILARGISYASLMMNFLGMEGGGFHFYGHSSRGKTTLLQIVASVVGCGEDPARYSEGHYIQGWDSTYFGIELMASAFNNTPFLLDELHKYHGTSLDSLIYTIAGGKGKTRGQPNQTMRKSNEWLNMIVSTGEYPIPAAIAQSNAKKVTTGQQVRILDILTDENVFIETKGMEAQNFVEMIKENCSQYYGVSGEKFIENLVEIANDAQKLHDLKSRFKIMTNELKTNAMTAEQSRVLAKFAAIKLGLYMAIEYGLVNLINSEVDESIELILGSWLENTSTLSDIDKGIENIKTFLLTQPARFKSAHDSADNKTNIVGYRDEARGLYLIIPEKFEEVCGKSHTREILKELVKNEILFTNNTDAKGDPKPSSKHSVSGVTRRQTLYAIRDEIFNFDEGPCDDVVEAPQGNVVQGIFG